MLLMSKSVDIRDRCPKLLTVASVQVLLALCFPGMYLFGTMCGM